jgi:hypothetical protein
VKDSRWSHVGGIRWQVGGGFLVRQKRPPRYIYLFRSDMSDIIFIFFSRAFLCMHSFCRLKAPQVLEARAGSGPAGAFGSAGAAPGFGWMALAAVDQIRPKHLQMSTASCEAVGSGRCGEATTSIPDPEPFTFTLSIKKRRWPIVKASAGV